ncbi:head-tail adaptor protein [Clostridium sediminicola]|uniref:hypothetical protein n=1 Tax=Clostridium sediminicola TaxID=3114879 RepID=UPI0031F244BB
MKKILSLIIMLLLLFSFTSCKKEKIENVKEKDEYEVEEATKIVKGYLDNLISGDLSKSNSFLSENIKENSIEENVDNMVINSFKIEEVNESEEKAFFTVKVSKQDKNSSKAILSKYLIKVKKENMEYKIEDINNSLQREIFSFKDSLRIRFENATDTNLLVEIDGIGSYIYPKDDKAKLSMKAVPKDKFALTSFSYEGDLVAITTEDSNTFVGVISIDETTQTAGEEKEKEPEDEDSGKGMKLKEKPMGKNIIPCDLLMNSKVSDLVFSLDEKYLIAQYIKADSINCFRVYSTESGDLIPVKLEEEFPLNKVDIYFVNIDDDKIYFDVIDKDGADEKYLGRWQIDLKEKNLKKDTKEE